MSNRPWSEPCRIDTDSVYGEDTKRLSDCQERFDYFKNFSNEPSPMKRITKQYTVWKLWHEPKDIAVDIIYTLAIYGFVRLCMDVWSWLV
jgi:hypothetical protein